MAGLISKELHQQIIELIRRDRQTPNYSDTGRGVRNMTPDASTILFKAPTGGIPKRVGTLPGQANCTLWGRDSVGQLHAKSKTITIRNWATTAVCSNGDRYGWAAYHSGSWWAISEDCSDGGSSSGGTTGTLSSNDTTDPFTEDVETTSSVATVQDVPYKGSLDAATVPA